MPAGIPGVAGLRSHTDPVIQRISSDPGAKTVGAPVEWRRSAEPMPVRAETQVAQRRALGRSRLVRDACAAPSLGLHGILPGPRADSRHSAPSASAASLYISEAVNEAEMKKSMLDETCNAPQGAGVTSQGGPMPVPPAVPRPARELDIRGDQLEELAGRVREMM